MKYYKMQSDLEEIVVDLLLSSIQSRGIRYKNELHLNGNIDIIVDGQKEFVVRINKKLKESVTNVYEDSADQENQIGNDSDDDGTDYYSEPENPKIASKTKQRKQNVLTSTANKGIKEEADDSATSDHDEIMEDISQSLSDNLPILETASIKVEETYDTADVEVKAENKEENKLNSKSKTRSSSKRPRSSLKTRFASISGQNNKSHRTQCKACDKTFATRRNLLQHKKQCKSALVCKICSKSFNTKSTLQSHKLSHLPDDEHPYKCGTCGAKCSDNSHLKRHSKVHSDERDYPCETCNKQFKSSLALKRHSYFHLPDENHPLMCITCGKKCNSKSNLERHMLIHKTPDSVKCDTCGATFKHKNSYNAHMKQFHKSLIFVCEICKYSFSKRIPYSQHMAKVHNDQEHIEELKKSELLCEHCGKAFCTKEGVHKHTVAYHLPDEGHPHKCEVCGAKFGTNSHLLRHRIGHDKTKSKSVNLVCKCPTCGKYFENTFSLKKHQSTHDETKANISSNVIVIGEENSESRFTCKECSAEFSDEGHYNRHMEGHKKLDEDSNPVCKHCNLSFKTKTSLLQHERRAHFTGDFDDHPFKCSVCNSVFGNMNHLKRHQLVHSDIKEYLCSNCGKAFRALDSLRKHEKMFHQSGDDYKFQCKICKHRFGSMSNLDRHMLKHTGDKPHLCSECGRSFKQKKSLEHHQEIVHQAVESEKFKCDVCSCRFNSEWSLERHKLIHITLPEYTCEVCNKNFTCSTELKAHHIQDHPQHCEEKAHQCDVCCKRFTTRNYMLYHITSHLKLKRHKCPECGEQFKHYCSLSRHMKKRCKKLERNNGISVGRKVKVINTHLSNPNNNKSAHITATTSAAPANTATANYSYLQPAALTMTYPPGPAAPALPAPVTLHPQLEMYPNAAHIPQMQHQIPLTQYASYHSM